MLTTRKFFLSLFGIFFIGIFSSTIAQKQKPVKTTKPTKKVILPTENQISTSDELLVQFLGADVQDIYLDVTNSNVMFAATPFGVYKSSNRGVYWQRIFNVLNFENSPSKKLIFAQSPAAPNVYYIASSYVGIWKSVDGGQTWSDIAAGVIGVEDNNWELHSLIVSPEDASVVYVEFGNEIYKTLNGGKSWGHLPAPRARAGTKSNIKINPFDSNHIIFSFYSGNGTENSESFDGGMNWSKKQFNIPYKAPYVPKTRYADSFEDIWYSPTDSKLIYVNNPLAVSEDGGNTWNNISFYDPDKLKSVTNLDSLAGQEAKAKIHNLAFSKESVNKVYAATDKGTFISKDKGKNWGKISSSPSTSVLSKSPNELFVVTEFGLQKFDENSQNWSSQSYGLPHAFKSLSEKSSLVL